MSIGLRAQDLGSCQAASRSFSISLRRSLSAPPLMSFSLLCALEQLAARLVDSIPHNVGLNVALVSWHQLRLGRVAV